MFLEGSLVNSQKKKKISTVIWPPQLATPKTSYAPAVSQVQPYGTLTAGRGLFSAPFRPSRSAEDIRPLTEHFETGLGLDLAELVLDGDPVEAGVAGHHVAYLHGPAVVVLAHPDPAVDADRPAVLLPRRPRRRVSRHAAPEPDRVADVRDLVVQHGVELWRAATLRPLRRTPVRLACRARAQNPRFMT